MADEKSVNVKKEQAKYRALQYTFFGSEFIALFAPFIAMGIANFDEWFVNDEGWKVGIGGGLAMLLLGVLVFVITKKKEENSKVTDGFVTFIAGWFLAIVLFWLLEYILDQIVTIMLIGSTGLFGAFGLNLTSKSMGKKADLFKEAQFEANKELLKEQAKEEIKAKSKKKVAID